MGLTPCALANSSGVNDAKNSPADLSRPFREMFFAVRFPPFVPGDCREGLLFDSFGIFRPHSRSLCNFMLALRL